MRFVILSYFIFILSSFCYSQENSSEPFLPQIFSQFPNVRDIGISPDGDEVYFSVQSYQNEISVIAYIRKENNVWSNTEITSFSGKYYDIEPFLSANGLKLYFSSNRPIESSDSIKDFDIWYVQRENKNSEWSKPVNVGEPINSDKNEFYPSIASNNNFYFTCDERGTKGKDDIFFSQWKNEKYIEPISLSDSINSDGYEFNAFIAPNESFIIFTGYSRDDGFGSGDLYISYKNQRGDWGKAKNLGPQINSAQMDYCPFVDTKTNTLYFTSKRTSINSFNKHLSSIQEFLSAVKRYDNGLSRIYKASLK